MRMNTRKNVSSLLSFFLLLYVPKRLNAVDPCIYDLNAKGIINLTSIGHVDGTPVWKSIPPEKSDGHVYSYNPCHPFTLSSCKDVAACQTYAKDEKLAYSLGTQNSMQWKITSGQEIPTLVYTSTERTLSVDLRCLKSGEPNKLEVHGYDAASKLFTMTLSSQCVCWGGCKDGPGPKPKNGLSGGTFVLIFFVGFVFIYLVAFMSFNKFKRQATGVAILPHHIFWASLLGYSLDGVKFLFRKVTGKETKYTTVP